jgi:hypothetical protein
MRFEQMPEVQDRRLGTDEDGVRSGSRVSRSARRVAARMDEAITYIAGVMAIKQPYNTDGSKRPGGDEEGFIRWLTLLRDFCAARAPYQTPRLASVTIREEAPDERREYPSIRDMEIELIKQGLPIEHLKRLTSSIGVSRNKMQKMVALEAPRSKGRHRPYNEDDRRKYEESVYAALRKDFWSFRLALRPNMIPCWWQKEVADHLTLFWSQFKRGMRPKLVLGAPPQHGKTETMRDFAVWVAGKDPTLKIIFASYADELGIGANLHMQRMMQTDVFRKACWKAKLLADGERDPDRSRRTTTFLEFVGKGGSFRNTTVDGKINGFGLDIGIIDDPIKGRAEAQSKPVRDKTWNWLIDDFFNRFSDRADPDSLACGRPDRPVARPLPEHARAQLPGPGRAGRAPPPQG